MTDLFGQSIGRYHILEPLGEGGMATVYKAYDTHLERDVAIKIIRMDAFSPLILQRGLVRFEREAKALARLNHSNIVTVIDYGEQDGEPYLVMQYIAGGTLKARLGKPLAWQEAARLLLPVARGLAYAHQRGIVHRDVKPSNILITESGDPLLTDFGIAKLLEAEDAQTLTGTGVGIGTPEYMAPEQGLGHGVDGRADLYSLGIVFYELITGRKPYSADTPMAVVLKHVTDPLPRPAQYAPGLPDAVEKVLIKALAKQPEDRYPSMDDFARSLETLLENQRAAAPEEIALTAALDAQATLDGLEAIAPDTPTQNPASPAGHSRISNSNSRSISTNPDFQFPSYQFPNLLKYWPFAAGLFIFFLLAGFLGWLGAGGAANLFPTAGPSLTPTFTTIPTPAPSLTPAASPTPRPSATPLPTATPALGIGSTQIREKDGMMMIYVPEGPFTMGSEKYDDEKPVHSVTLDAFWIDRTEVTNAMFETFANNSGYRTEAEKAGQSYVYSLSPKKWLKISGADWQHPQGPDSSLHGLEMHPVVHVSWNDAAAYCKWADARLPSEAEWEKAARGVDQRTYPWGNLSPAGNLLNFADINLDVSWADKNMDDSYQFTAPVGHYPAGASSYGALDMAGNVGEWVNDWYGESYYSSSPSRNPTGPTSGKARVLRGGSWHDPVSGGVSANRNSGYPSGSNTDGGFRCARSR